MRFYLSFILIFILKFSSFSQQNLAFSRVVTFSGSITGKPYTKVLDTVPPGKVWKLEAKGFSGGIIEFWWTLNDAKYENIAYFSTTGGPIATTSNFNDVIWLKSGDRLGLQYGTPNYPCGNCSRDYFISILEFTVN